MEQIENETKKDDDEISLIDLFAVLLAHKKMIITVTALAMIGAVVYSIISLVLPPQKSPLPNKYTPSAHMLINDSTSSGGGLSSILSSSGLGSLASLAGVSANTGSTYSAVAVYLAESDSFLDTVAEKFDIIARYKIKRSPKATSRKMLKKTLKADMDKDSGVFTISFTDIDPVFAQSVVNFAVDYMDQRFMDMGLDKNKLEKKNLEENIATSYNEIVRLQKRIQSIEASVSRGYGTTVPSVMLDTSMAKIELEAQQEVYKQLKSQYELLKIKMQSETPVFQVLDRAEVCDMKSAPSRGKLCIIITFAAFFMAVFASFALNAVDNIRKDPEAMKKLRSSKGEKRE